MKFATMNACFDASTDDPDFLGTVETEVGDIEVRFSLNDDDLKAIHAIIERALADALSGMN